MRLVSAFIMFVLLTSQIVSAADWPLSTDLFKQGYTNEEVEELAGKPKGSALSTNRINRGDTVSSGSSKLNGQYLPPQYSYNELGFNEYRVNSHGQVYYQTENRGSRMDGYDEFYYVNEH